MSQPTEEEEPLAGVRILERLRRDGLIDDDQRDRVLDHAQKSGESAVDAAITLGVMSEADLLKHVAKVYSTRFVSTDKLRKAGIDRDTLIRVPFRLASHLQVCPILFQKRTHSLAVVAADVEQFDIAKQVQMVSGARSVQVYVARPAAVLALIKKYYQGDAGAFEEVVPEGAHRPPEQKVDEYDDWGGGDGDGMGMGGGFMGMGGDDLPGLGGDMMGMGGGDLPGLDVDHGAPAPPASPPPPPRPPSAPPAVVDLRISAPEIDLGGLTFDSSSALEESSSDGRGSLPPATLTVTSPDLTQDLLVGAKATKSSVGSAAYLETLNVLVTLLEQDRSDLRGHTSLVARLTRKLGERIGLSEEQMHGMLVAAYLHDIGKASAYHLTALNVAQYEGHRIQAQKTFLAPLRLMESVGLPDTAEEALTHLYERFDGRGFPDRLSGKDVPLGARILAVAETYADLTSHAKNPYRKKLSPQEAVDAIGRYKEKFFDPTIVALLERLVLGEALEHKLLADRRTVLLVDPDAEETTVLEMRLMEHGFDVQIAREAEAGLELIRKNSVDIVVCEVELGGATDGFAFAEAVSRHVDLPLMFLTRRGDRESVQKGFRLGAADYLVKPASAEVVAEKARQTLDRATKGTRGVSGSLTEMSLPDVIQILSHGRKSGRLSIRALGKSGEVHFGEGIIYDARFGSQHGEEAFYAMLLLVEGDFVLDPSFVPTERVIHANTESLLLEGMRRMDEGTR